MTRPIRVASGLVVDTQGLILMARRPVNKYHPDCWELPGGKEDPADRGDLIQTLRREWQEELQVDIEPIGLKPLVISFVELVEDFTVHLYPIRLLGSPVCVEHSGLSYYDPTYAVRHRACSPAFYLQYRSVRDYVRNARAESIVTDIHGVNERSRDVAESTV